MNDGKSFERLNKVIQEAYKNLPDTEIIQNYKISNKNKNKREIDILVISKVNGFEIKIAIECKDYSRKVSVEKVEAFHGKCSRISGINKKIMVSPLGFQRDAINASKDFDIELFLLKDISKELLLSWIDPNKIIRLFTRVELNPCSLTLVAREDEEIYAPELTDDLMANFLGNEAPKPLINLVFEGIQKEFKQIHLHMVSEFILDKDKVLPKKEEIHFGINLQGVFVNGKENRRFFVSKISSSINAILDGIPSEIEGITRFSELESGLIKAEVISIDGFNQGNIEVVKRFDSDDLLVFVTDKNGITRRLQDIARYDRISDKWEFFTKKKVES